MASDVLRTGDDLDLDPRDEFVDDNEVAALVAQHVTDALELFRGEYLINANEGIRYIDFFSQKGRASIDWLVRDLGNAARAVPGVENLVVTSSTSAGYRTLTVNMTGTFGRQRADASVEFSLTSDPIGQNQVATWTWNFY